MANQRISASRNKYKNQGVDEFGILKIKTENNFLGTVKISIIVGLIILQVIFLVLLYLYLSAAFAGYLIFSLSISLITCIYILSTDKNSQSKPMWILFLLISFGFGYIIYWISDAHVFFRKYKKQFNKILEKTRKYEEPFYSPKNLKQEVKSDATLLYSTEHFSAYDNTIGTYYPSGTSLYDAIIEEMEKAKEFIFMEYFIVSDGILLKRIMKVFERKIQEGVKVKLIYDDFGSMKTLSKKTKLKLTDMGVELATFNKLIPYFNVLHNFRDHRKITIIDGKVAFTGGANLADEYINEKRMHGYWKDAGIRIEGRAVKSMLLIYLRQFEFVSKKEQDYDFYLNREYYKTIEFNQDTETKTKKSDQSLFIPFADGLEYSSTIGKDIYTNLISQAKEKLYIMTPYFVPDDTFIDLLTTKATSGVDVRIILPGVPDKKFIYNVTLQNAKRLVKNGVKIYIMNNSFLHSKIVLNEHSAVIGTININMRSFYQQFEDAIYVSDKKVLQELNEDFSKTFTHSTLMEKNKKNTLWRRIITGICRLLSPLM